jgi:uncharacterized membrane protein YphA (DoxX/SURF4 family)
MPSIFPFDHDSGAHTPSTFAEQLERFFFLPTSAHTLACIRILTGAMLVYVHLIWMMNLDAFMGPNAMLDNKTWQSFHHGPDPDWKWTYLSLTDSMTVTWIHELAACSAGLLLAVGFQTRIVSILAWFLTLMTVHRMTGMLFGLDQIVIMLSMYLCLARPGDVWSVDARLKHRNKDLDDLKNREDVPKLDCWTNTLATRLIQLHLCVIYLFGGIGKMRGEMWWDGTAIWYSAAAYEYQSIDLTWIGNFPIFASVVTHITVFWELSYCALIWPRWSRPWMLGIALLVHVGIGLFLGMITFGWIMLVANLAFVPAKSMRRCRTLSKSC